MKYSRFIIGIGIIGTLWSGAYVWRITSPPPGDKSEHKETEKQLPLVEERVSLPATALPPTEKGGDRQNEGGDGVGTEIQLLLDQNKLLNALYRADVSTVQEQENRIRREQMVRRNLVITIGVMFLLGMPMLYWEYRNPLHRLEFVRVHKPQIHLVGFLTLLVLLASLTIYDLWHTYDLADFSCNSGVLYASFAGMASTLGCLFTVILYLHFRNPRVSWPSLLASLIQRLSGIAHEGGFGVPSDHELNILVYSPNPGYISCGPNTEGGRKYNEYYGVLKARRDDLCSAEVVCYTNFDIHRMLESLKLEKNDAQREEKFEGTLSQLDELEKDAQEGPPRISSRFAVWRHGRVPNIHFYLGGYAKAPSWAVRFLIHREPNGSAHEVSGLDTADSEEIGFLRAVFREYKTEIACPIWLRDLSVHNGRLQYDMDFYAQQNVALLRICVANTQLPAAPGFVAELPIGLNPSYVDYAGRPAATRKDEALLRLRGTTDPLDALANIPNGTALSRPNYECRGEFVKKDRPGLTSGQSRVWPEVRP